jgi:hypothetical protein
MTFALVLIVASISSGLTSARPSRPNDPPLILVSAPARTHGAPSELRSGSVPGDAQPHPRNAHSPTFRSLVGTRGGWR